MEILRLAAGGMTNSAVAKSLWVTDQTVKFHLANTCKKLDVRNRTEAVRWFQEHGFDDDPEGGPGPGVREPHRPIKPTRSGGGTVDPREQRDSSDDRDTPLDAKSQAA